MAADDTTGHHSPDAAPTRVADAVGLPQQIGPYTIVRTIGRGGVSVVYLARDSRNNRDVALKVIPAGADADQVDLARFRTEAEAVERLDHPNIVHLYDAGTADGVAYLAMEYVDGGTLYRRIKDGRPIDPLDAARLVEQLARGIHYSHQNGVLHRDLKPSNILLSGVRSEESGARGQRSGAGGNSAPVSDLNDVTAKIADFGLAKQLDRSLRLTQAGTAVGTPSYMAPEQARGERAIGPAIDVHGLGTILYELLTGLPPFMGNNSVETMEQVVHKRPTRPSEMRRGIPPALEAICMKCLEKEPKRRYASAAQMADDLRRVLDNPSDTELMVLSEERARTRRVWLTAAVAIAILAVVSAATAFITWAVTRSEVKSLRQQAEAAGQAERRAKLESAITLCERGQVSAGLEQMRALEGDPDLPIREFIDAWDGRLFETATTLSDLKADVAAMSPTGKWLATANGPKVQLRRSADWQPVGDGWELQQAVTALGWSEDEVHVAIGTNNGSVLVGNTETGELKPVLDGKGKAIAAVGFTFAGVRVIYSGDELRPVYFPPLSAAEKPRDQLQMKEGPYQAISMSPNTGQVAAATHEGRGRLFHVDGTHWGPLGLLGGDVSTTAFAFDGNVLAIGNRQGQVQLWDAVAHLPLQINATLEGPINAVAVGYSDTTYTVVACPEGRPAVVLRCKRPWAGPPIRLRDEPAREAIGVAFSGDGSKLFVTSPAGVSVWRVRDAKRYGPMRDYRPSDQFGAPLGPASQFSAPAAAGPDGAFVVGGSGGKVLRVDGDDAVAIGKSSNEMGPIQSIGMGPKGEVCSAGRMGKGDRTIVRYWAGRFTDEPVSHELNTLVYQESYLPDGSAVVLACGDGKVRVWEPAAKVIRAEYDCGSPVLSVAVESAGRRIIAGCADGTAQVKDLATGGTWPVFRHQREVRAVAFIGLNALTASADGTCRRWHLATGLPLGPTLYGPGGINSLAVWNDLMATGSPRHVRVWRFD
jgi:serine/threonine protein kinase/WD40 repeat protein